MRNLTKAFLFASMIYLLILAIVFAIFLFFSQKEKITKHKVDLSTLHLKKITPKPQEQPKVPKQQEVVKKPKETAKSIKDPQKKLKQPKIMPQAKIDSVLEQYKKEPSRDPLIDSIYKKLPHSIEKQATEDPQEKLIKELYGGDYTLLSSKAKEYLKDNYEVMHAVTQNVLNRIGRVYIDPKFYYYDYNLVEFTLYPDGSISDIKMLKNAGFELLNKITKETIETAFKDYPPSEEPILLRYKFLYDLRSF